MTEPSYPPARAVASRVRAHLAHQALMARERGETDLAPEADLEAVETIIDCAFWASLRREEGYTPTISLANGTAPTSVTLLQETRRETPCTRTAKVPDDWRETLESYRKEIGRVRLLQPGFELGLPYSVITLAELRTSMQTAGYDLTKFSGQQSPGAEVFARFPGGRLVAFSAVGFNATKSQAMLTVHFDCFPSLQPGAENSPCHQYDQVMMEKQEGRWVPARLGGAAPDGAARSFSDAARGERV